MKTKKRILDVALDLFNKHGTSAVSTNHIAEAAGISPGNLYYHYRNKEEIIRAIFERVFDVWNDTFALASDQPLNIATVRALVHANFRVMSEYCFLYRELIVLLRQDDSLRERYMTVRQRGYDGFHEIFSALAASGALQSTLDHATIERLADLCWLISEFWLSSIEVGGKAIDENQMQRGIDLMMQVLNPYLKPEGE
jgi:AcrR family transcriptional regulator